MAAALETFDSPIPMDENARTYGVALTSAQAFAAGSRLVGMKA
jgi:hypothetical protein